MTMLPSAIQKRFDALTSLLGEHNAQQSNRGLVINATGLDPSNPRDENPRAQAYRVNVGGQCYLVRCDTDDLGTFMEGVRQLSRGRISTLLPYEDTGDKT